MSHAGAAEPFVLAPIRQDLQIMQGAPTVTGKPTWMIFDPVQHRYFEIDFEVFEVLVLWNRFKTADQLIEAADAEQGREVTLATIQAITRFISSNNLSLEPEKGDWRSFSERAEANQKSAFSWLIHNYLFVKIPLVRPTRFLRRSYDWVGWLFRAEIAWATLIVGLIGIYLVSRQWDDFTSTFANFLSLEGAIIYGVALVIIKVLHELGHAYMATRYGCRVPTMGVAFLVMFPVLYTDVTDAWKLASRRKKLMIGAAGLMVELSLASYATFLWAFLPEGNLKSIAFVVATITWTMSVAVNLNPLMRFDGYYLLSDFLSVGNLQARSFALGRWKLREILFGLGAPPPEKLPPGKTSFLAWYAFAVWIYRFFLFIGIALLVYTFAFKALGILLFVIEIVWFIALPIWSEIKEWPAMSKAIFSRLRIVVTLSCVTILGFLFFTPLSGRVDVPAVVEPARYERIFPPVPAKLEKILVRRDQPVRKGAVLFLFSSPELSQRIKIARIERALLEARLARLIADRKDKSERLPLLQELSALKATLDGYEREQQQLTVRAPFSGRIKEVNTDLHANRWVRVSTHLATLSDARGYVAKGYIRERDLWRVKNGNKGRFVPDDYLVSSSPVAVEKISLAAETALTIKPLTSVYGGMISTRKEADGSLVPVGATYLMTMQFTRQPGDVSKVTRGVVHLDGVPESFAARIWREVLQVLVRESGA